jgi:hypothetical protein
MDGVPEEFILLRYHINNQRSKKDREDTPPPPPEEENNIPTQKVYSNLQENMIS